jgi:hypothetical protein
MVAGTAAASGATMENLTLIDAYSKFGAKPANRLRALSAIGPDGTLVLSCTPPQFSRASAGVLRYEDRLSRDPETAGKDLLAEHLTRGRDEQLAVRMVVVTSIASRDGKAARNIHVRKDLIGKVTVFDGDHFIVDFTRVPDAAPAPRRK